MTAPAFFLCFIVFAIGVACVVAPSRLVDLMVRYSGRMLYPAAGFRILFGSALVLAAPASRAPEFILILGIIVILAGVVMLFVGQNRFRKMIDWLVARGPSFVRLWGVLGIILGCALGYALIP